MRGLIAALLLWAAWLEGLNAQCPEPELLKDANNTKLCARLFESSHYYNEQSCGGRSLDVYPGDDAPELKFVWNNRISSLVVSRQCSLTVWSRTKKQGKKKKFSTGIQYRLKDVDQGLFGDWDNDISGYFCEC
ncbi:syncollin-like [Conger conger]|uniref:syncollin-like n=1 Tax=Conger conger TaxID=82655 RepID=UPI002A5A62D9|nr:syncollin-like [Conger conger]